VTLRISLLGEQSIVDDATGAARSRSARTLALAAYLVVHTGTPQPRQRIASLFWSESTDAQALTNLRRELHNLRHALAGEACLAVTARDLCWHDGGAVQVDLRVFDLEYRAAQRSHAAGDAAAVLAHAAVALGVYRGDLLPGVYDDWVLDARAELQEQCVQLCASVCMIGVERGEFAAALDAARMRIRLRPFEEVGYRVLMQLQAGLGDRAAAVSTYHRCASVLERELGVEPDEATRGAVAQLLARSPQAEPVQHSAGPAGPGAVPFIGRARELGVLQAAWQSAAIGRPGVVLVRGSAGVGKSRLVTKITEAVRRAGAVAVSAQCFATSGRLALAPVAEWLRSAEVQVGVAGLDPVWRAEVERLVPSSSGRGESVSGTRGLVDAWQRHRFYEGLARALLGAGRPMLLVLDNVQWCDQETLAFLTFCFGLFPDAPVLLAATLRADRPRDEPELAGWTSHLRAAGTLTELSLGPLGDVDTARLAEAIRGRPLRAADRGLLVAVTGGFPLHVVEAMRAMGHGSVPAGGLDAVLRSRLGQASPAAQEVAGLAAAVGRDFTLDLLAEAGGLGDDDVVQAVDELWRRRILREHGEGYDFSHDLLRDAAYEQVSRPRRWLLHRRVAQGLELLHADDIAPVAAQLAEQYARGGRPERALGYYRRAADVAAGVFAHAEAARLHHAALEIVRTQPSGPDTDREELAILEALAAPLNARHGYASAELQAVLERSIELAESLGRRRSLVDALVGLWSSRIVQGRTKDAHDVAARALALVEPESESSGAAHFAFAGSAVILGRPAEALQHFATAAAFTHGMLVSVGTRPDVHGRAWAAHAHWLRGEDTTAEASARKAIELSRSLDHPYSLAVALAYAGITRQMRGDRSELRRTVAELRELCTRYGFGYYREWGLVLDGWCCGGQQGVDLARQGIENLIADGALARQPYWLALLADLLDQVGDSDTARATLDAAAADARARDDVWWLPEVLRMRAGHDGRSDAVSRLHEAAGLAEAQGSVALLRRCALDLAALGVRPDAVNSRSTP
jgi:DNA-binding SARP family transcriptional activator/tetratricopeptide (TPR) repeat protein